MADEVKNTKESDFLNYTGNKIPGVIKLVWAIFIVFMFIYLIQWTFPNLMEWVNNPPQQ